MRGLRTVRLQRIDLRPGRLVCLHHGDDVLLLRGRCTNAAVDTSSAAHAAAVALPAAAANAALAATNSAGVTTSAALAAAAIAWLAASTA